MQRFLKNIAIYFLLPGLLFFISCEVLLRNIPNSYSYKKHYLDDNAANIEVLILGASNAYYNLNPIFFKEKCFNLANVLQSLNFDSALLNKYGPKLAHLKQIIIPISTESLFFRLENSFESERVCNYVIYYNLDTGNNLRDHFKLFNYNFRFNINRIIGYYVYQIPPERCSELGYGTNYNFQNKKDLKETGELEAKRFSFKGVPIDINLNVLKSMINFAKARNIKVLLFTPPSYHSYIENLDSILINQTINAANDLAKHFPNVEYVNLLSDSSFTERDFYDADHLDEYGAQKLSLKLDSIITNKANKDKK